MRPRQVRLAYASELPVAAFGGGQDLFGFGGLGAYVRADRRWPFDNVITERAETLDLDLDHVTGIDGAGDRRRSGQQDVARLQRDRARDVGNQIVHVPLHLVGVAVLAHTSVHHCADLLAPEIPPLNQSWAYRAQGVGALYPTHR